MHKGFPGFPGGISTSPHLSPCTLGGADPTPAPSGGGHLIQDGQSDHRVCLGQELVRGWACDSDKTNQKHEDSILGLFLNCWKSALFFSSARSTDSHLATTAQKVMVGDAEGWKKLCKPSQHRLNHAWISIPGLSNGINPLSVEGSSSWGSTWRSKESWLMNSEGL